MKIFSEKAGGKLNVSLKSAGILYIIIAHVSRANVADLGQHFNPERAITWSLTNEAFRAFFPCRKNLNPLDHHRAAEDDLIHLTKKCFKNIIIKV